MEGYTEVNPVVGQVPSAMEIAQQDSQDPTRSNKLSRHLVRGATAVVAALALGACSTSETNDTVAPETSVAITAGPDTVVPSTTSTIIDPIDADVDRKFPVPKLPEPLERQDKIKSDTDEGDSIDGKTVVGGTIDLTYELAAQDGPITYEEFSGAYIGAAQEAFPDTDCAINSDSGSTNLFKYSDGSLGVVISPDTLGAFMPQERGGDEDETKEWSGAWRDRFDIVAAPGDMDAASEMEDELYSDWCEDPIAGVGAAHEMANMPFGDTVFGANDPVLGELVGLDESEINDFVSGMMPSLNNPGLDLSDRNVQDQIQKELKQYEEFIEYVIRLYKSFDNLGVSEETLTDSLYFPQGPKISTGDQLPEVGVADDYTDEALVFQLGYKVDGNKYCVDTSIGFNAGDGENDDGKPGGDKRPALIERVTELCEVHPDLPEIPRREVDPGKTDDAVIPGDTGVIADADATDGDDRGAGDGPAGQPVDPSGLNPNEEARNPSEGAVDVVVIENDQEDDIELIEQEPADTTPAPSSSLPPIVIDDGEVAEVDGGVGNGKPITPTEVDPENEPLPEEEGIDLGF